MEQRKSSWWNSSEINTHLFRRNLPAFFPFIYTPPPALFFKSPRPCLSSNVIISRLKARLLIIVLYVALCLVSDSIHLCGHHFITFLVTEVKKINGNQITLLTERLKGQCVKFTVHHLSFKTFHFFLLFIFIIIYSTESRAFPNTVWPCICLLQSQAFLPHHRVGQRPLRQAQWRACRESTAATCHKVLWKSPKGLWLQAGFVIHIVIRYCVCCRVCYLLLVLIKITVIIQSSYVPQAM